MPSSWLATILDQEQIELVGKIADRAHKVQSMPDRSGRQVADELGGRFLARYLTPSQVTEFNQGSDREHWVTPTAVAPEHVVSWLALPAPLVSRAHVLLLDPERIETIKGPAWIRLGQGIEYYLPHGFPADAVVGVGAIQVT